MMRSANRNKKRRKSLVSALGSSSGLISSTRGPAATRDARRAGCDSSPGSSHFIASERRRLRVPRAMLCTDSQYVYEGAGLAPSRQAGQSAHRDGRPLANPDLWREFLRVRARLSLRLDVPATFSGTFLFGRSKISVRKTLI